jgi:outer membrane protein OmpA-like peptidoglycan-associated protein
MKSLLHITIVLAASLIFVGTTPAQETTPGSVPAGRILGSKAIGRQIEVEGTVSFSNLQFKLDSVEFANDESARQLGEIATALKNFTTKGASFLIEGHTCDLGDDAHNLDLSKRRAAAVRTRLVTLGVPAAILTTAGRGETSPLRPNDSDANRALNRRVAISLIER